MYYVFVTTMLQIGLLLDSKTFWTFCGQCFELELDSGLARICEMSHSYYTNVNTEQNATLLHRVMLTIH